MLLQQLEQQAASIAAASISLPSGNRTPAKAAREPENTRRKGHAQTATGTVEAVSAVLLRARNIGLISAAAATAGTPTAAAEAAAVAIYVTISRCKFLPKGKERTAG